MADSSKTAMNGNVRAASASPIPSSNEAGRGSRPPPPPVRPKPKRTITAPILMTPRSEICVIDEKEVVTDPSSDNATAQTLSKATSGVLVPSKGTVKALAERFDATRAVPLQPSSNSASIMKSTAELFEANNGSQESKRQRIAPVGATSTILRFAKPTPPGRRQTTSLIGELATSKRTDENENAAFERNGAGAALASVDQKRGSLERRRKQKDGKALKKGGAVASANGDRNRKDLCNGMFKNGRRLKRSQSCNIAFDRNSSNSDRRTQAKSRRRWKSLGGIDIPALAGRKMDRLITKAAKKTPPAVPPKPTKKLALAVSPTHEYAEYDVLPSAPSSVFSPPSSSTHQKPQTEDKRSSLPDRRFRQLPEAPTPGSVVPSQLYDSPARLSLGTPSSGASALSTMELLDDSQLNISGHIYCAVTTRGEVIEDDDITNRILSLGGNDSSCKNDDDDDEPSFSAAVFGAIEQATGRRIAVDEYGNRIVEEDAMTNYEEIIEDFPLSEIQDDDCENKASPKLPPSLSQPDDKPTADQSSKWETCSSLTSTSADSGSSSTNAHAPMLIAFRRRSSNERRDDEAKSKRLTARTLADDDMNVIDDPTPTQAIKSYSPLEAEKRERDSKSAPRTGARLSRQARPKSQLDLAANSLWRIKSDIQLNLSQAMGKIRLKVSSSGSSVTAPNAESQSPNTAKSNAATNGMTDAAPSKKVEQKARSTFYLPSASPIDPAAPKTAAPHPTSISITLEAGLGEEIASSTAASSDEDDDDDDEEDEGTWDGTLPNDREGGIAGGDSEETTPTAGASANLPDLVSQAFRKQGPPGAKQQALQVYREDDAATTDSSSPTTTTTDGTLSNSSVPPTAQGPSRPPLISESSCSSTVASGLGELERFELVYNSRFAFSEPLYQHYRSQTAMVQRNQTFSEGDGKGTISRREKLLNTSQLGSQRTLWCELPEVQGAGLLQRMSDEERKLQEAMFEVITSEASYLRSLNILITQFMASPHLSGNTSLGSCITKQERKHLFSNILSVRDCSERLLCALESRLEENVLLEDVCDLLYEHLRRDCEIYVKYCSNQIYQERTLNDLRRTNAEFRQVAGQLEANPVCECLNLRSFLMLPMQRVTRYPLLIAAILQRTEENSQRQATAQRAYGMAGRVVRQCNEGAKRLERIEQLVELDKTLVYREGGPKRVAFVSGSRWLIKKGAVIHLLPRRHTLGVRGGLRHRRVYLFLFTDLLLIAKPIEGEKRFVVKDYCQRQFVEVVPLEPSCSQVPEGSNLPSNSCLMLCTLMKNHRGRQVELIFNCESETDKTRWLEAIRPASAQEDGAERIYEPWDCPQVRVVAEYHAIQEDELELEIGEIINVLRKMPDGWYEGERLRDGEKGWFPGNLTEEILSDHIRAKNYRDRLRFINEAEMIQRSIYMGDGTSTLPSSSGTNCRRSSIIPTAAKALFRF